MRRRSTLTAREAANAPPSASRAPTPGGSRARAGGREHASGRPAAVCVAVASVLFRPGRWLRHDVRSHFVVRRPAHHDIPSRMYWQPTAVIRDQRRPDCLVTLHTPTGRWPEPEPISRRRTRPITSLTVPCSCGAHGPPKAVQRTRPGEINSRLGIGQRMGAACLKPPRPYQRGSSKRRRAVGVQPRC